MKEFLGGKLKFSDDDFLSLVPSVYRTLFEKTGKRKNNVK